MRFIAIIFSFFLLAVSVSPCDCVAGCEEFVTEENHRPGKEDSHDDDHCAHFCAGPCCGIIALLKQESAGAVIVASPIIRVHTPLNDPFIETDAQSSIWQPPRFIM